MENILTYAESINKINNNEYFKRLNNLSLENFISSQTDFIYAVDNWSKILGIMVSKVPSHKERAILIKNLYDEHGNGNLEQSHVETFKKLLHNLNKNISGPLIIHVQNIEYINIFNNQLLDATNYKNWIFCIGMLAMVEYTYITVSNIIHNYISKFIVSDDIHHYSLHEIIDETHSIELFQLVESSYTNYKDDIFEGMNYGYQIMYELYKNLSN